MVLGDIAIRYGYQRYQDDVMVATLIITVILVQVVQSSCNFAVRKIDKRKNSRFSNKVAKSLSEATLGELFCFSLSMLTFFSFPCMSAPKRTWSTGEPLLLQGVRVYLD